MNGTWIIFVLALEEFVMSYIDMSNALFNVGMNEVSGQVSGRRLWEMSLDLWMANVMDKLGNKQPSSDSQPDQQ